MSIQSVSPGRVTSRVATPVVVTGAHFDNAVSPLDLNNREAPDIERSFQVKLERVDKRIEAQRIDATRLRFTVPAGLAPGRYGVTVTSPSGTVATRARALTVTDELVGLTLSIETSGDGLGDVVTDRDLASAEPLSLHAVLRAETGMFVSSPDEVTWRSEGSIGALSESQGSRVVFSSDAAGTAVVIATHAELGEAKTGTLRVLPADGATISIEDAAGGRGSVVGARTLTTDDTLELYAVSRDPAGNFVRDESVRWNVAGRIGASPASASSSLVLNLSRPGVGRVRAEHALDDATTGVITVRAGRAAELSLSPLELTLNADDDPVQFTVSGRDADDNETSDFGTLSWAVESGAITALAADSGELDPRTAGIGVVRVTSAYGPVARTNQIEIEPGRAARLTLEPDSLMLTADAPEVAFTPRAADADGNATTDTGTLTFRIATGSFGALGGSSGKLDPKLAGSGTIEVKSSYGPSDVSGTITIAPGRAAQLSVVPETLTTRVDEPATQFSVTAKDADGNATLDVGALSWTVASGALETFAAGTLTPTAAGEGVVRASSAYGPAANSGTIVVAPLGPPVELTSVSAPGTISRGQRGVRVEITVANRSSTEAALLSSVYLALARSGASLASEYTWFADSRNPSRLEPGTTATLTFYLTAYAGTTTGQVELTANLDAFVAGYGAVVATKAATFNLLTSTAPNALITRPLPPEDRVCVGAGVSFSGSNSGGTAPLSYAWSFSGGSPSTSAVAAPSGITYATPGRHLYALTVTDSTGDPDTAYGNVYVGTSESIASATYPTGRITFALPTNGGVIDLADLPSDDALELTSSSSWDLRQCNGAAVSANGNNFVTLWADRGVIDPAADVRPNLPGIQIALHDGGTAFDTVNFLPGSPRLEGAANVYAEYYNASLGVVTASGSQVFYMDNDTQAPTILVSRPASDCGSCYGTGWPFIFQFSEPMSEASLANVTVWASNSQACGSFNFTNVTASSSGVYEVAARTLYVRPPAFVQNHSVRVTIGNLRDASSNANLLTTVSRCVQVSQMADASVPAVPSVISISADPFSPDGDGLADDTTLVASVDANTRVLRLEITRGTAKVRTLLAFVNAAGNVMLTWDGRDHTGRTVPDGFYRYALSAENAEGERSNAVAGVLGVDSAVHFNGVPSRY